MNEGTTNSFQLAATKEIKKDGKFVPYLYHMKQPPTFIRITENTTQYTMTKFTNDPQLALIMTDREEAEKFCQSLGGHWKIYEVKESLRLEVKLLT